MHTNKRIHVVLGTKAQLIKMAPVMHEMEKRGISYNFIFTGQHKETIDKLRDNFSVKTPDKILYDGKDVTGILQMLFWLIRILYKVIFKKNQIFGKTSPDDVVLVHGDTFSTVLGALMGKLAKIKVAHIESGLRSFKLLHPFPEEINRLITFYLSDYYFCPGEWAVKNLEKYKGKKINTKLNTLFDSLELAIKNRHKSSVEIPDEKFALCSIHRFENIFKEKQFKKIIEYLEAAALKIKVLFILHPPTLKQLKQFNLLAKLEKNPRIELRPRYDYFDFINLLNKSEFIITDGGSNQEEAYYLGKPCLLMRAATERTEGLDKNVVISNYNESTIRNFIEKYQKYKISITERKDSPSPTSIIIDNLV